MFVPETRYDNKSHENLSIESGFKLKGYDLL